ncbi:MAG: AI-2E family transporter [Clostridiales bacterium]|nr:AI-2E family transporter [Clostridiales bacterium]
MKFDYKYALKLGTTVLLFCLVLIYWGSIVGGAKLLFKTMTPIISGLIIAYAVNILMSSYERRLFSRAKAKWLKAAARPVSMLLAYFSVIVVGALIIGMIIPELVASIKLLASKMPDAYANITDWLSKNVPPEIWNQINDKLPNINWDELINKYSTLLQNSIGGTMGAIVNVFSSAFSAVITAVVGFVFSIYLLYGKDRILNSLKEISKLYLGDIRTRSAHFILHKLNLAFRRFISGQCIEAVILGVLCTIGMYIIRLPYASMIGSLVGFTALIPIAGAYIGAGVGAFMISTQSPMKALIFIIFIIVLQQLEGNLIYPRVVGASLKLPGFWVLAAVTIGGGLGGILGMLIGVPLTSGIYSIARVDIRRRRIKNCMIQAPREQE